MPILRTSEWRFPIRYPSQFPRLVKQQSCLGAKVQEVLWVSVEGRDARFL